MNKVIVTGGCGFLGGYIARGFHDQGWQVSVIDQVKSNSLVGVSQLVLPITSPEVSDHIYQTQPDVLIHAAGTASVQNSMADADADFARNVGITEHLLNNLKKQCPQCKTIFLSSAAVYGNPQRLPIREEDPTAPISPYGFNKRMCEMLVEEYAAIFDLPACSVRIFSAYGQGLQKQILWDICTKIKENHKVVLSGTGHESRDMIHAQDIFKGILLLTTQAQFRGEAYNLSSGHEITINELASKLIEKFDPHIQLEFSGQMRAGDPINWRADISKIKSLGFSNSINIDEGLQQYADWFKSLNG